MNKDDMINCLKSVCKYHVDKSDLERIELLSKNIDDKTNNILLKNKVELLFLKHCKEYGFEENISPVYWKNYGNSLLALQFKYEEYLEEIYKITREFEKMKIPYAILKGFSFIGDLWSRKGIVYRYFSDVDLLVSKKDLKQIHTILSKNNYVQGEIKENKIVKAERSALIYWALNSHQIHEYTKFSKYSNVSCIFRLNIDINTTIFEGGKIIPPIKTEELLKNTISKNISDKVKIICLNYTYGLIQLCYHFYKDMHYENLVDSNTSCNLMKFCDLREFVLAYRDNINWNEFKNIIKKNNIEKQVLFPLFMVSSFYDDLNLDKCFNDFDIKLKEQSFCWENLVD